MINLRFSIYRWLSFDIKRERYVYLKFKVNTKHICNGRVCKMKLLFNVCIYWLDWHCRSIYQIITLLKWVVLNSFPLWMTVAFKWTLLFCCLQYNVGRVNCSWMSWYRPLEVPIEIQLHGNQVFMTYLYLYFYIVLLYIEALLRDLDCLYTLSMRYIYITQMYSFNIIICHTGPSKVTCNIVTTTVSTTW